MDLDDPLPYNDLKVTCSKASHVKIVDDRSSQNSCEVEDDDDTPRLSSHTLAALKEFLAEEAIRCSQNVTIDVEIQEDWQLSQFWYTESTATILAKEALEAAGESGCIACISCPTVYKKLRQLDRQRRIVCLEFDRRFSSFGCDFIFYDYNNPLDVPEDCVKQFTVVVCDPPFLSEECLSKTASTVKLLTDGSVILCTGKILEDLAKSLLGVTSVIFQPEHNNNLANEFSCFTNFTPFYLNDKNVLS